MDSDDSRDQEQADHTDRANHPDGGNDRSLGSLQTLLLSTSTVEDLLVEVARLAAEVVVPPASCGITTSYDRRPRMIATSDARAALVDEEQYSNGEGPCLESMYTGQVVDVPDLAVADRWPGYAKKAAELGVLCSVSYPLVVDGAVLGALNVYGYDRAFGFTDADRTRVAVFATRAATALQVAIRFARQTELARNLERALTSRSVIDQAIGVLMGQQRCNARTAFDLLRSHSQRNNIRLRDVAIDIIQRYTGQPPSPPPRFERRRGNTSLSK